MQHVGHRKSDEIAQLHQEIERLRAALKQCVKALDSKEMEGVWNYLYVHGYKYNGPVIPMLELRALLGANEQTPPDNKCDCAESVPEGYLCGKPTCPRTIAAEAGLRKLKL